ncbi:MAG TPA: Hsp20/alpha crystallin family protein [Candidatus Limnocylindria bacterium]|nr:Hsp20/alpha crystallin family protein [Candidatus Limnocylindria bacterium]
MVGTIVPFSTFATPLSEPFVTLREAMDRLFDESVVRPVAATFPIDVRQTADEFVVTANVPGVDPEKLTIDATVDSVAISGQTSSEAPQGTWLIHERPSGAFVRKISLPLPIEVDDATSTYANGVLTLTLPKAAAVRPRQIKVKALPAGIAAKAA